MSKFDDNRKQTKKKVIVFINGGITYQENRELQLMAQKQNFDIIVGSNAIINSEKFTQILSKTMSTKKETHEDENEKLIKKMA
jgi:tRNA-dihydrouridine synthase